MVRRHYNWGRDRLSKSGAAHPTTPGETQNGGSIAEGHLPLRYTYAENGEQREIVLDRTEVRLRRVLETQMTMTMTVQNDSYLGVSLRKGWDGDAPVLVHQDAGLSLPLPTLYDVPIDLQAKAWAEALGVPCLAEPRRPSPRRHGNPLTRRTSRKTARRRYVRPNEAACVTGAEMCAPG